MPIAKPFTRCLVGASLLSFVAACGAGQASPAGASTAGPSVSSPAPLESPPPPPTDAGPRSPAVEAEAGAPLPKPPPVTRTGKTWPFHAWDHAEAVTFNQFAMRPEVPLLAYDESGWSPHLVDRKPITEAQAKKAVELVTKTEGDVAVSKCPFPRHAVVLYEKDTPVASINVCFSCGDIMLWPRWAPAPDWEKMSDEQMKEHELRSAKQMKLYDKVFPLWKTYFRDEIGFPIDAEYH